MLLVVAMVEFGGEESQKSIWYPSRLLCSGKSFYRIFVFSNTWVLKFDFLIPLENSQLIELGPLQKSYHVVSDWRSVLPGLIDWPCPCGVWAQDQRRHSSQVDLWILWADLLCLHWTGFLLSPRSFPIVATVWTCLESYQEPVLVFPDLCNTPSIVNPGLMPTLSGLRRLLSSPYLSLLICQVDKIIFIS